MQIKHREIFSLGVFFWSKILRRKIATKKIGMKISDCQINLMKSFFWIDKTPNEKVIMGGEGRSRGT